MNTKELDTTSALQGSAKSLDEQILQYKKQNPDIERILDLFNTSKEQYDASINSYLNTKTYITTSTLLPTDNG